MADRDAATDILVVGSGMGGGALAYALADSGARVTVLERGSAIPREPQNWAVTAVFVDGRYKARERWQDAHGRWYEPGITYAVGGNTKVYGASLPRFRPTDFKAVEHADGVSPAWPFDYAALAPFYAQAERLFGVHGAPEPGQESTRVEDFPYPPVPHEPPIQELARRLEEQGYKPAHLPLGIDLREHGKCVRCSTCDGFVCRVDAKADAEVRCVRPALTRPGVQLLTGAYVRRVLTSADGRRATGVEMDHEGATRTLNASTVVVCCGAVNSAALLLRSGTQLHPHGLANGSGMVGRNYMVHNNTIMLSGRPIRRNTSVYQKTLYVNDFYERGVPEHPYPLGHVQLIGRVEEPMTRNQAGGVPRWARRYFTSRSLAWWLFSEDLPDPDNRVELTRDGNIRLSWRPNNTRAHELLTREAKRMARASGYPIVLTRRAGQEICSHQAGTVRAGNDPSTSVLDPNCRAHELENLYVVDASFFPSLPVMNPALTIAANALRVGAHLRNQCTTGAEPCSG